MDYFVPILAYLVIGFAVSFYLGKRVRRFSTIETYIKSGLIVLFWPIGPLAILLAIVCSIIAIIAYGFGRTVHFIDDGEVKDETTN